MNNKQIIYYRSSLMEKEELQAAQKHFTCVRYLNDIPEDSLVIPRYSMFPFFLDQMQEIKGRKSKVINSHQNHLYVANIINYYFDLQEVTPKTWFRLEDIPENDGPYILKGSTNSKKNYWNKMMYAENKREAIKVHGLLCEDTLLCNQDICVRKYVPLVTYAIGLGGVPITKEFRYFILNGQIVSSGYYWQNYADDIEVPLNDVPKEFVDKVINIIGDKCIFYVVDIAKTKTGEWIVIELNDGMQSGLSMIDPESFYSNLKFLLKE